MSPEQIINKIKNDPEWLIELYLSNNPEAVVDNAHKLGYDWVEDEEDVVDLVNVIASQPEPVGELSTLFDVDFKPENAPDEVVEALDRMNEKGDMVQPIPDAGDGTVTIGDLENADDAGTVQLMGTGGSSTSGSGGGGGGLDLSTEDYLRGLGGAIQGMFGGGAGTTVGTVPGQYGGVGQKKEEESSLMDWLPWIIALIAVVVLIILFARS